MGFGNMVPNRGWFVMPWEPSKPTQMFAFTILVAGPPVRSLETENGASTSGLGKPDACVESEQLSGNKILFAPCSALIPRVQASAATRLPYRTHREVWFVRKKIPLPEALCYETELRPSPKGARWFLKLTIAYFAKASTPWNCVGAEAQVPFLCLRGQPRAERHRLAPGPQGNAFSGSLLPKNTRAY